MSNSIIGSIYSAETGDKQDYKELLSDLSEATGLEADSISTSLVDSFKVSCDMAEEYGLNKGALKPKVSNEESEDTVRDKMIRSLSFYASGKKSTSANSDTGSDDVESRKKSEVAGSTNEKNAANSETNAELVSVASDNGRNAEAIVATLNEISNAIIRKADINSIFTSILEGVTQGAGFDRAVLCFLSPDHKQYKARLGAGHGIDKLKEYFSFAVDRNSDLFSKVMFDGDEILVTDVNNVKWQNMILQDYEEKTGSKSFVVASLQLGGKPVGLFYADMGVSHAVITMEHFNGFMQFITQAKLALLAR
jgi:hypothetical protein